MKKIYTFALISFLLGQSLFSQNVESIVSNYLRSSVTKSALKTADVAEWQVTNVVLSLNPEIQHVYVQQLYQGIPIDKCFKP